MADVIQLRVQYSDGGAEASLTKISALAKSINSSQIKIGADVSSFEQITGAAKNVLTSINEITSAAVEMEQALLRAASAGGKISVSGLTAPRTGSAYYGGESGGSSRSSSAGNIVFQGRSSAPVSRGNVGSSTRQAMQSVTESVSTYTQSWGDLDSAQINAKQSATEVAESIQTVGTQATKTGNSLLENAKKFAQWMILGNIISGVMRTFSNALDEMKKADSELVTVRKVTGMAADELERLSKAAYATSTKYGESASDYLSNVAAFARAGYGDMADKLAELSTKTQIVGDTTADTANQFLLSVDAAYKYNGSITALTRVLDGANEIDNKYATSIEKIADGLGIIAPVAAQANVGADELTAALGTITAVTQRSGTEAARALRAIFLNIAGDTKTEIEDGATWTAGQIQGLSDIIKTYAKDAYDAAQASGEVLNPMRAIEGLSKSMKDGVLTASQLYEMISDIGGKLRASQLTALVQNWDMYESMLSDYAKSYGSAEKEVENALDSWDRKAKQLQNTWTEFVSKTVDTSFIKWLLDVAKNLLSFENNLGLAMLKWTAFIAALNPAGTLALITKIGAGFGGLVGSLKSFGLLLGSVFAKQQKQNAMLVKTSTYQRIYNRLLDEEAAKQGIAVTALDTKTKATIANTAATKAARAATIAWIGIAIGAALTAYQIYSQVEQKAAAVRQEIIDNSKETAEQVENVVDLIGEYRELNKERENGEAWNASQISQAKSLQEQLTALVGDQAKQLDLVNGNYDDEIEKLKEILKLQAQTGIMDASDAEKAALKNAKKAISRYGETVIPDGALLAVAETLKDNRFVKLGEGAYTVDFGAKSQIATAEDALAYFNEVKTLRATLFEDYSDTKLYKELSDYIAKYKDVFEELETALKTKQRYQEILEAVRTGDWSKIFSDKSENNNSSSSSNTTGSTEEALNDVKKLYDELEKVIKKRLDARKKELDAMKQAHEVVKETLDLEEKRLKVEEARKALESAEKERTIRVYNAATGQWEWQADESAIEKAKESLKSAEDDLKEAEWQQQYNEKLRAYEAEKAQYEELFDIVDDITDNTRDINAILKDIKDNQLPEYSKAFEKLKLLFADLFGDSSSGQATGNVETNPAISQRKRKAAEKKELQIIEDRMAEVEEFDWKKYEEKSSAQNGGKYDIGSVKDTYGSSPINQLQKASVTNNNSGRNDTRNYYLGGITIPKEWADRTPFSEALDVLALYTNRM